MRGEQRLDLVDETEVHEVGAQEAPHQELGGEVVEPAVAGGGAHPALEVARDAQQRAEELPVAGVVERGAHLGERRVEVLIEVHPHASLSLASFGTACAGRRW